MPNEDATQQLAKLVEINKLGIKIPSFDPLDVEFWFRRVEGQFPILGIVDPKIKFYYLISGIENRYLKEVRDLVTEDPDDESYNKLKKGLLTVFQDSEDRRITKLLDELELGDRKPTALLREMRALGGKVDDSFLQTIFVKRLPVTVRQILSASKTASLTEIVEMAD